MASDEFFTTRSSRVGSSTAARIPIHIVEPAVEEQTLRVLLIETEPVLAEITAFRLELLGFRVDRVPSGPLALTNLQEAPPDAIVVDLGLGDADDLDLLQTLANDPATSNIPVLALSARAEIEDVQRAFTAGVKDYLVTPYDPVVLEHKLDRLLAR